MADRMGLRGSRAPIGVSALFVIVLLAFHALVLPAASRPLHEAEATVQPEKVTVEASEVRAEEVSADESTSIDGVVRVSRMLGTCTFPDPLSLRVS
ncbi:unnamed protein product [Sphagnum jensenii]|uniref:Uncharacterized protein n=1 Tax=Sphagnum jensenii TaxID=128206 RepID=A0ABP0VQC0_9BRYO